MPLILQSFLFLFLFLYMAVTVSVNHLPVGVSHRLWAAYHWPMELPSSPGGGWVCQCD